MRFSLPVLLCLAALVSLAPLTQALTYGYEGISEEVPTGSRGVPETNLELSLDMEALTGPRELDYFADNGNSQPQRDVASEPEAVYSAETNRTYVVYNGGDNTPDPYITYYDHGAQEWATPVKIANGPLTDDAHGTPVLWIDPDGILHVFYGSHSSALYYRTSYVPHNISTWVPQSSPVASQTYANLVENGTGDLYMFYRRTISSTHEVTSFIWSTDGASTWNGPGTIVDFGTQTTLYHNNFIIQGDRAYFGVRYFDWSGAVWGNTWYQFYFNLTDSLVYSMSGADQGTTVSLAEADACCIVDSGSPGGRYGIATQGLDSDGIPYLIYAESYAPDNFALTFTYWTGAAWQTPEVLGWTDEVNSFGQAIVSSPTSLEAFLVTNGTVGSGGQMERWTWDGATWTFQELLHDESVAGFPVAAPVIPRDFITDLRLVYGEEQRAQYTVDYMRLYAWGDGFVTDIGIGQENAFTDFSINENEAQMQGERFAEARPDATLDAGAWTVTRAATHHEAVNSVGYNDDTDYVNTSTNGDDIQFSVDPLIDPDSSGDHFVHVNARSFDQQFNNLLVELRQDGSLIASETITIGWSNYGTYTLSLSGAEADAITDYQRLEVWLTGSGMGGGDYIRVTWVEVEVPDEPTGQVTGTYGLAWDFDGFNDYLGIGDNDSLERSAAWTLHYWLNLEDDGNDQVLWNKYATDGLLLQVNASGDVMISFGGTENVTLNLSFPFGVNASLTVTYDNLALRGYLNGSIEDTVSEAGQGATTNGVGVLIGQYASGDWLNGTIDEVLYFSAGLSAAQVEDLSNPAVFGSYEIWLLEFGSAWVALLTGGAIFGLIFVSFYTGIKKRKGQRQKGKIWRYMPRKWR